MGMRWDGTHYTLAAGITKKSFAFISVECMEGSILTMIKLFQVNYPSNPK
jgi:hypothetical protein